MSKSLDFDFVGLYGAILKDVASYFPNDQREWDRDLSRITHLSSTRGLPVFTMDLPAIGKQLDSSLSRGHLDLGGMNLTGSRHPGSKIPRLFWGLWSRLFDDSGCLKQHIDPNVVFFLRTLLYVGKNLRKECPSKYFYEALEEWFDVEAHIPVPSQFWEEDGYDLDSCDFGHLHDYLTGLSDLFYVPPSGGSHGEDQLLDVVQQCCDVITGDLGSIDPESLEFKHGPGAVGDHSSGWYKYHFRNWGSRLETLFPFDRFGSSSGSYDRESPLLGYDVNFIEMASTLYAVPKTQKGPRLIAAEPSSHQWIQQGIRRFLYSRVERSGSYLENTITFSDQNPSRRAALDASRTGRFATIDLKSASDRISTQLVQRVFRRNKSLLATFVASRTRFMVNRYGNRLPTLHKLRKFSTQGSALTFPVQSIVFASICIGVGKYLHPCESIRALAWKVRVFGDDIVVPTEWEPHVEQVLHLLGLRVNHTKTHFEGNFRESCGMDAFEGHDVTPAYVTCAANKSDPRSIASVVSVANNFFRKGLWHAATWIDSTATMRNLRVVDSRSGIFGLISFTGSPRYNSRWNESLQKWEVLCLQIFAKSKTLRQETEACLLQFFTECKSSRGWKDTLNPIRDFESGVPVSGVPVIRHTWVPEELMGVSSPMSPLDRM